MDEILEQQENKFISSLQRCENYQQVGTAFIVHSIVMTAIGLAFLSFSQWFYALHCFRVAGKCGAWGFIYTRFHGFIKIGE